jgi:hypothetical protein
MQKVNCPYCLTSILQEAEVCNACGRDVAKIFSLQKELTITNEKLRVLEQETGRIISELDLTNRIISPQIDLVKPFFFFIVAIFFQLVITILLHFNDLFLGIPMYSYLTLILTSILIYLLLKKEGAFNMWAIMILFFIQPYTTFFIINFIDPSSLNKDEIGHIIKAADFNLITIVIVTIIIIFMKKRKNYYHAFSFKPLYERVSIPMEKLENIDKVGLLILSIAATIGTIYKFFFK